jgi:hypothetical protein
MGKVEEDQCLLEPVDGDVALEGTGEAMERIENLREPSHLFCLIAA